jgi:hypothetical protein
MPKSAAQPEWCIVRLGEDHNWWVDEISDPVHWDVDGLSIIDPRQVSHILELIEPLRDYGLDADVLERAFVSFRIDGELGQGRVRLVRHAESIFDSDEKLFALPEVMDDEHGPYADFLDHLTKLRVKMLNDLFDFEQKLTVDEVEEEIREEQNTSFMEGKAVHFFSEITAILDYVPAGWELDDEEGEVAEEEEAEEEDFPDIEEDEEEKLKGDETLRWDDDEEEEEEEEEEKEDEEKEDDDEEVEVEVEEDEDEPPSRRRGRG